MSACPRVSVSTVRLMMPRVLRLARSWSLVSAALIRLSATRMMAYQSFRLPRERWTKVRQFYSGCVILQFKRQTILCLPTSGLTSRTRPISWKLLSTISRPQQSGMGPLFLVSPSLFRRVLMLPMKCLLRLVRLRQTISLPTQAAMLMLMCC